MVTQSEQVTAGLVCPQLRETLPPALGSPPDKIVFPVRASELETRYNR
jgi:hypothetical protein